MVVDMASIFSRIIDGEIPGRFVWRDPRCVAFLTAAPLTPGHTLVVSRDEIEQWTAADPDLIAHIARVAHAIGRAQQEEWEAPRVGLLAQGFEVPHLHWHVWPVTSPRQFSFSTADADPDPAMMDDAAARLRARLRVHGHGEAVPAD